MDKAGPRLFFPQAEESIVEVQKLVKLADYECMSIVNASGELSSYIPLHPLTCPYRLGRALLNRPLHPLTPPYQASSPSSTATTRSEATSQVTHGGPTVPTVSSPEAAHRRSGRGLGPSQEPGRTRARDACWGGLTSPGGLSPSGQWRQWIHRVYSMCTPGGMRALAEYVHSKGLKFGVYTARGSRTCQTRPGAYGHEVRMHV